MVVRRDRKVRRQRGSRLYGWGTIGQHRKSGMRGGFGNAGLHKHKWSWAVKYGKDHYGKDGFVRPAAVLEEVSAINVGSLQSLVEGKVVEKDEKGRAVIDLSSLGYDKLLGSGKIDFPVVVKASKFTELAKKKVAEAGGELMAAE
ncbi:MAG: uL15 family ribosomal protein [Candidatus Methanosuratincola sp.]